MCRKRFNHITKTKVDLNKSFRRHLLSYKDKATIRGCRNIPRGDKRLSFCCPGVAFAIPSYPITMGIDRYIVRFIAAEQNIEVDKRFLQSCTFVNCYFLIYHFVAAFQILFLTYV